MNQAKALLKAGKTVINGWLAIPSAFSAEVMAQCGWDSVTVDIQHGVQDYQSMVQCFQGMQGKPVTPLVRPPWNEPGIIGKVLDGGAMGVICPMINTPDDARRLVTYAKYPPDGQRSNGPIRAGLYGESSAYQDTANAEVLIAPMMETVQAVGNMEAILDVPGIDLVYVGPSDLAFSLGLRPALDREEPAVLDIYARLLRETARRGIAAGIHIGNPVYGARMIEMGFRFISIANDVSLMAQAAKAAIGAVRQGR